MFETVGHGPRTQQRFRIGATRDGTLLSMHHEFLNQTSILDDYKETCGKATPFMYSVPNLRVASALARANVGAPTSMRGPGAVPGLYAVESAKFPFSSRHLLECMQVGAERFGWARRDPQVGAMKRDGLMLGWGMAACTWGAMRDDAQASVEIRRDGTAVVRTATQDIGTGTYTVLAFVVAEVTGIPLDRIDVRLGDTTLPPGPISGGSWTTASVIPAVSSAARAAVQSLLAMASSGPNAGFPGAKPDALHLVNGRIAKASGASSGVPISDILARANVPAAIGSGQSGTTFGGEENKQYVEHAKAELVRTVDARVPHGTARAARAGIAG